MVRTFVSRFLRITRQSQCVSGVWRDDDRKKYYNNNIISSSASDGRTWTVDTCARPMSCLIFVFERRRCTIWPRNNTLGEVHRSRYLPSRDFTLGSGERRQTVSLTRRWRVSVFLVSVPCAFFNYLYCYPHVNFVTYLLTLYTGGFAGIHTRYSVSAFFSTHLRETLFMRDRKQFLYNKIIIISEYFMFFSFH